MNKLLVACLLFVCISFAFAREEVNDPFLETKNYSIIVANKKESIANKEKNISKNKGVATDENKVSLSFQDVEVRYLLQLFAEYTKCNMVISDAVVETVSIHLHDIYWKEAFNLILKSQGLAYKQFGNIIYISKNEEILANEKISQEYKTIQNETKNLTIDYVQVHFADSSELVTLLIDNGASLLSVRGKVSYDKRTNKIIIQDFAENILKAKKFIRKLDVPLKQVLIETQIVKITNDYRYALGIKPRATSPKGSFKFDFNLDEINTSLGFSLARLPKGILVDLELQALEKENKATIYACPKLLTLDKQTAIIESGKEIPYVTKGHNNSDPYVIFKKAALRLEVTPYVNPRGKILLNLKVNKDQPGIQVQGIAQAPIDTTQITTKVIVKDGETIVLGGIFSERKNEVRQKVPFLGDIPIIGKIFTAKSILKDKSEILIFVTPRLVAT